jgi:hypothetical protein
LGRASLSTGDDEMRHGVQQRGERCRGGLFGRESGL